MRESEAVSKRVRDRPGGTVPGLDPGSGSEEQVQDLFQNLVLMVLIQSQSGEGHTTISAELQSSNSIWAARHWLGLQGLMPLCQTSQNALLLGHYVSSAKSIPDLFNPSRNSDFFVAILLGIYC